MPEQDSEMTVANGMGGGDILVCFNGDDRAADHPRVDDARTDPQDQDELAGAPAEQSHEGDDDQ